MYLAFRCPSGIAGWDGERSVAWLAPGVVHDILNGGCGDVSMKQLRHGVPELWREQVPGMVSSEVEA